MRDPINVGVYALNNKFKLLSLIIILILIINSLFVGLKFNIEASQISLNISDSSQKKDINIEF